MSVAHGMVKKIAVFPTIKKKIHLKERTSGCYSSANKYNPTTHTSTMFFGHRHLPLELEVEKGSTYYNLGEWVHHFYLS